MTNVPIELLVNRLDLPDPLDVSSSGGVGLDGFVFFTVSFQTFSAELAFCSQPWSQDDLSLPSVDEEVLLEVDAGGLLAKFSASALLVRCTSSISFWSVGTNPPRSSSCLTFKLFVPLRGLVRELLFVGLGVSFFVREVSFVGRGSGRFGGSAIWGVFGSEGRLRESVGPIPSAFESLDFCVDSIARRRSSGSERAFSRRSDDIESFHCSESRNREISFACDSGSAGNDAGGGSHRCDGVSQVEFCKS